MVLLVVFLSTLSVSLAQFSVVKNYFPPLAVCQDQRHFFGSEALAVPEFIGGGRGKRDSLANPPEREDWSDGPARTPVGSTFSPVARASMCDSCSVLFNRVFAQLKELQLGLVHADTAAESAAENLLAPPNDQDLCSGFNTKSRFAHPRWDYPSHADHLLYKKKSFCFRLVRALQHRYGQSHEIAPAPGMGGRFFPDPSEEKHSARVMSFEAAAMNVYQKIFAQRDFTPDLSKDQQAAFQACEELRCC